MENEQWLPAPDWPEYEVSNLGRVKRVAHRNHPQSRATPGTIRKLKIDKKTGYLTLRLTRPGHQKTVAVHVLVCRAFHGEPPAPNMEVNHDDSDRANPRESNLYWVTKSQNRKHGYDHGYCNAKGSRNGNALLDEAVVVKIRKEAAAGCRDWRALACRYGVSPGTIRDIATRRTWRHVE